MSGLKIIVAGAGLGGRAAASNQMKVGHDVTIFEQAPELSEVGAGIQLSANAMHVLNHIGLGEAITKVSVKPGAYVFRTYDTGDEIHRFSLSDEHEKLHGAPYHQLHRANLHDLLAAAARDLKSDVVRLNHTAVGYEERDDEVELFFSDGSSATGDMLIGADGLKSVVRHKIAGDVSATYTGDAAWRITVPADRLPIDFMGQVMSVSMGPGSHSVCYYLRGGEMFNFVGCIETDDVSEESWTAKFPWEKLQSDFVRWHDDIQTVIKLADKDQYFRWSLHTRPAIPTWNTKRVTLLGIRRIPPCPIWPRARSWRSKTAPC